MDSHSLFRSAAELVAGARPLLIGHRGCAATAPENTLPSFRQALTAGVDLVELDYHHCADGVPVVIHDDTLDRTTNARKLWKRTRVKVAETRVAGLAELDAGGWFDPKFAGARIPLLAEALEFICRSGRVALVERKSGDPATCARVLRDCRSVDRAVVISFDWVFVRELHELEPRLVLGALGVPERLADGRPPARRSNRLDGRWLDELEKTGSKIAVWHREVPAAAVSAAHKRGLKVWVYTVDRPGIARSLLAAGVDGIITNKPGPWVAACR